MMVQTHDHDISMFGVFRLLGLLMKLNQMGLLERPQYTQRPKSADKHIRSAEIFVIYFLVVYLSHVMRVH